MYSKEEAKQVKLAFWTKMENRTRRLPGQRGKVRKWIFDDTGVKGVDLRFDVTRTFSMVALEINHRDEDRRLKLFEKLDACKSIFEQTYGDDLEWELTYEKLNGQDVSRIYKKIELDYHNQENWKEIIPFLVKNMVRMEEAFSEVKDFLIYDELGQ